ncbi:hypothetical protein NKH23_32935, partial [Mesorhizobium sp. M1328]|uniref:hypothetical protein n=1 Tax=Mesorhizobium sp. M1328 TaxID=2957082 RepID=UPI003336592E
AGEGENDRCLIPSDRQNGPLSDANCPIKYKLLHVMNGLAATQGLAADKWRAAAITPVTMTSKNSAQRPRRDRMLGQGRRISGIRRLDLRRRRSRHDINIGVFSG